MAQLTEQEREFLRESNAIEREYSDEALEDSIKAWQYAKDNRKNLTEEVILNIHKILMQRLTPEIAGKFRDCPVYISKKDGYEEVSSHRSIETNIAKWMQYRFVKRHIAQIKWSHIEFELIHPFEDGNGRVGRILMNLQILNANKDLWIIHTGFEQKVYYKWFNEPIAKELKEKLNGKNK